MAADPQTGTSATCEQCKNDIMFVGPYWVHVGELKPKHPAIPQTPNLASGLMPAEQRTILASGLMPAEQRTMDALLTAWQAFRDIPEDVPTTEAQKFRDAIHDAQCVLTSLIIHRLYPDYWR